MSSKTEEHREITWEDHWRAENLPWDAGASSPALVKLVESLRPPEGARALVPGCGSGYDVFVLALAGFHAVGVDLAPSARPRFERLRLDQALNDERSKLVTANFFELTPEKVGGRFDFIWDYTFYCAIDPSSRDAYKSKMLELLAPGGTLALLLFPVVPGAPDDQGPPYVLVPDKVKNRFGPELTQVALTRPHQSHPGREGKEWLALFQRARS